MHQEPGDHRERERERQTERQTERETSLTDVSQRHAHDEVHGLCTSPETSADDGLLKQRLQSASGERPGYATGPGVGSAGTQLVRVRVVGSGQKGRGLSSGRESQG